MSGGHVIDGGSTSSTVIVYEQEAIIPALLAAVTFTILVPCGNWVNPEKLGGVHVVLIDATVEALYPTVGGVNGA